MAYSPLSTKSSNATITTSDWSQLRDNFAAGFPDLVAAKGDLVVGTGVNAGARLAVGAWGHILIPDSSTATGLAWHPQPICVVTHNAEQDPTVDDWFTLAFNTENADSGTLHSTVTNNSRITVPVAGFYRIKGGVEFKTSDLASGQSGVYGVRLLVNGTTDIKPWERFEEETQGIDTTRSVVETLDLDANDYVQLQAYTNRDVQITANVRFWVSFDRVPVP